MDDRAMSDTTVHDFLDGLEDQIEEVTTEEWRPGVVIRGDTEDAGTVLHDGDQIPIEQFEARLEHHEETHGPVESLVRIELNVHRTDAEDFENEVRSQ